VTTHYSTIFFLVTDNGDNNYVMKVGVPYITASVFNINVVYYQSFLLQSVYFFKFIIFEMVDRSNLYWQIDY
jgi:hypothetical protein